MRYVPERDWQLYEVRTVDYICPVCLHVERVKTVAIEGEDNAVPTLPEHLE